MAIVVRSSEVVVGVRSMNETQALERIGKLVNYTHGVMRCKRCDKTLADRESAIELYETIKRHYIKDHQFEWETLKRGWGWGYP
jgi:hypothetical protein